ncbi:MAG: penicillin-binding protein [Clostridiales bacterium]|nr:penicillin-binding protein [Clostridiales bacterium]
MKKASNMKKAYKVVLICLAVFVGVVLLATGFFFLLIEPDVTIFGSEQLDLDKLTSYSHSVTLLDAYGNPIDDAVYFGNNNISVDIDTLPEHTLNAFIAIEDKRYYSHHGVDYKRMASAFVSNIKSGGFHQGASTITQQLIKNTHLSNEKTLRRKISEIRLARKLERVYGKRRILESYLNVLYFGSGIRGLGTASRVMFDKPASELTLAQSAALASIINNPAKYSPYNNIDNLNKRKRLVLKEMLNQKLITKAEYDGALVEPLEFGNNRSNQFVTATLKSACYALNCSEKTLLLKNYTVYTSYDPTIAGAARTALSAVGNDYNARVLVVANRTGGIVCDETNGTKYINPKRSPASTIKPFTSYAVALESGLNPLTQIFDEPTVFGDYAPSNYKDVYRGYLSMRDCLKYSSNVAAVKLMRQFGVEQSLSVARRFGLNFEQSDSTLAVALGGMEKGVTLLEIANAYRTLANGGVYTDIGYVNDVINSDKTNAYKAVRTQKRAVGDDTAYLLTDMLLTCAQSGTAKKLKYSGIIAAKTGTNGDENGNYDCYAVAYTPDYTIAVWFGANDKPISNSITGASCCEVITRICGDAHIDTSTPFAMPDSVAYFDVDYNELSQSHEVYLADPLLQPRYRVSTLLSKRHLPIRKNIDILDYYDGYMWEEQ